MGAPAVALAPITGDDVPEVGAFLHHHLNPRLSAQEWAASIVPPWRSSRRTTASLLADGRGGRRPTSPSTPSGSSTARCEDFCNLGAWCVAGGAPVPRACGCCGPLLAQRGYHFTDLSPSGNVVPLNRAAAVRAPRHRRPRWCRTCPRPCRAASASSTDPAEIERVARAAATWRSSATTATRARPGTSCSRRRRPHCYVMFRKDRRKGLPVFASILLRRRPRAAAASRCPARPAPAAAPRRCSATLAELRVVGGRPLAARAAWPRPTQDVPQHPGSAPRRRRRPVQRARRCVAW